MNLSISNIAWDSKNDEQIYELMRKYKFEGLEIAPTKIFPQNPYNNLKQARHWAQELKNKSNFIVSSMQSIWYGKTENIFNSEEERNILIEYTKKAIDFANEINCNNLVFGCPKNRITQNENDMIIAEKFFKELGDYAYSKNTVIGMEANPTIYNTNFINDTKSALNLIKKVNSKGFLLNLDIGTMICNKEAASIIANNVQFINHVHISEPYLELIQKRTLHNEVCAILKSENYNKFISIEMKSQENIENIEKTMEYVKGLI